MALNYEFKKELEQLINKHSIDNYASTPDFILASHIVESINNLATTKMATRAWYGLGTNDQTVVTKPNDNVAFC